MNILIVDDHALVRRGLRDVLQGEFSDATFGEAQDASEAISQSTSQAWDAVILDVNLPDRNGLEVLKEMKQQRPTMPVLMLSFHPEDEYALRALKTGADGYVSKDGPPGKLVEALKRVVAGGKYVSPTLAEKLADEVTGRSQPLTHDALSDREFQVLQMIASGKGLTEIGVELSLSVKTVSSYRQRILEKLNLTTNADLVRYAVEHRLIS